jgi:hypothetical protein
VIARLLPVGNFTASNLLAGALNVPFARFLSGNLAGLSLGVVMLVLFAKRALEAFAQPSTPNTLACIGAGAAMIGLCYAVASLFERSVRREKAARASEPGAAPGGRASAVPRPKQAPAQAEARGEATPSQPEPLPEPESNDPPQPSAADAGGGSSPTSAAVDAASHANAGEASPPSAADAAAPETGAGAAAPPSAAGAGRADQSSPPSASEAAGPRANAGEASPPSAAEAEAHRP